MGLQAFVEIRGEHWGSLFCRVHFGDEGGPVGCVTLTDELAVLLLPLPF